MDPAYTFSKEIGDLIFRFTMQTEKKVRIRTELDDYTYECVYEPKLMYSPIGTSFVDEEFFSAFEYYINLDYPTQCKRKNITLPFQLKIDDKTITLKTFATLSGNAMEMVLEKEHVDDVVVLTKEVHRLRIEIAAVKEELKAEIAKKIDVVHLPEIAFKMQIYAASATELTSVVPEIAELMESALMKYVRKFDYNVLFRQLPKMTDGIMHLLNNAKTFKELSAQLYKGVQKKFTPFFILRAFRAAGYMISEKSIIGLSHTDTFIQCSEHLTDESGITTPIWLAFTKNPCVKDLKMRLKIWPTQSFNAVHKDAIIVVRIISSRDCSGYIPFLIVEYLLDA